MVGQSQVLGMVQSDPGGADRGAEQPLTNSMYYKVEEMCEGIIVIRI